MTEVSNVLEPFIIERAASSFKGRLAEFEDTQGAIVKLVTYVRGDDQQPIALALHEDIGFGLVLKTDEFNNWQGTAVFSLVPVKTNKFRYANFDQPKDVEYGTPMADALLKAEVETPGFAQAFSA